MGIQKSFLRPIAFALLAASIIAKVHCLPKSNMDEQREQEMEGIRANILSRLGLTEPLDSGEPLTEDQEAIVAAFWDYQTDEKVKADMTTTKYTLVGQLRKQGTVIPYCYQYGMVFIPGVWQVYLRGDVIVALSRCRGPVKLAREYSACDSYPVVLQTVVSVKPVAVASCNRYPMQELGQLPNSEGSLSFLVHSACYCPCT